MSMNYREASVCTSCLQSISNHRISQSPCRFPASGAAINSEVLRLNEVISDRFNLGEETTRWEQHCWGLSEVDLHTNAKQWKWFLLRVQGMSHPNSDWSDFVQAYVFVRHFWAFSLQDSCRQSWNVEIKEHGLKKTETTVTRAKAAIYRVYTWAARTSSRCRNSSDVCPSCRCYRKKRRMRTAVPQVFT